MKKEDLETFCPTSRQAWREWLQEDHRSKQSVWLVHYKIKSTILCSKYFLFMEITEVFYPGSRAEWRAWLQMHHKTKSDVWVRTFLKASGKPSISYNDLVEESLCFGWIDGSVKKYDEESKIQRVTPRRKKTFLSELNRQRIWKLQEQGLVTQAGIDPIEGQIGSPDDEWSIPDWVLEQLKADNTVWENFQQFPPMYQRLKIGWIAEVRSASRRPEAQKRLDYLIKMTRQGKMYGTTP